MAHTFDDLVEMQRAADEAHARVLELQDEHGRPTQGGGWSGDQTEAYEGAWRAWRKAAGEVQAAITAYAKGSGEDRKDRVAVEADVKKRARHPHPGPDSEE
ncbi:hypothetical protein ACWEHT_11530 [Streptomyces sp. NPDC004646]